MRPSMMRRRAPVARVRTLALAYLATVALGCRDSTGPTGPVPADIIVNQPALHLRQRDSTQITPSVVDKDGHLISGVSVRFRSTDAEVATVSDVGVVTAVGRAGTATIVVSAGKVHVDVPVTVVAVSNGIVVTPTPAVLTQKGTLALSARVLDVVGTQIPGAPLSFASNNTAIVTVSPDGVLTSVGPAGTVVVTVTSDTLSATVPVAVPQLPTSLVAPTSVSVGRNASVRITGQVLDAVGTPIRNPQFTYASDNSALVSVGADGIAHAGASLGSANVTLRSGTLTATTRVSVVDPSHPAGTVDGTVTGSSWSVAVSSGGTVYAGGYNSSIRRGDLPSYALSSVLTVTNGSAVLDVTFNATGTTAYAAGLASGRLTAIDVARDAVLWSVQLQGTPFAVALAPDERTVYASTGDGLVFVIDVATRASTGTLTVGGAPNHLAVNRATGKLYANDSNGGRVTEIDMATNTVVRVLSVPGTPQMMVASPDGQELYVANEAGSVDVVDLVSGTRVAQVPLSSGGSGGAFGLALSPDAQQLYATMPFGARVVVIDRASRTVVNSITVVNEPRRVAFAADGLTAVVAGGGGVAFIR
ncbi:MAG: hypothetical protein ACJ79S_05825 [Gemmatimonadaceae bacterium]